MATFAIAGNRSLQCYTPLPRITTAACRVPFLSGDCWRDIDCAHAAGCRAVFDRSDADHEEVVANAA
jgi:hypothetical protein